MLVLSDKQKDFWDSVLPKELLKLNEELTTIDQILNDDRFFKPIVEKFNTKWGRPTIPVSLYLRMMYLKHRYQLGYELLVKEVKDSIQWRRFCGLSLSSPVPDSTTLIKLTKKYGEKTIEEINNLLTEKLKEKKVIRGKRLRIDSTIVESDIHYPTDANLIADGVRLITRVIKKIKRLGVSRRTHFQDHTRLTKKALLKVASALRDKSEGGKQRVEVEVKGLMRILHKVHKRAQAVQRASLREMVHLSETKRRELRRLKKNLSLFLRRSTKILRQTKLVLSGKRSIPRRMVSFFDPEARPICQGKLSQPVQFGRKVVLQETENGIITGYKVCQGNPRDSTLLRGALRRHIALFGRPPPEIATDRGFSSASNERWLKRKGVKRIAIPKRGKKSKERKLHERQHWFKRLQRFRAGAEAKISLLKRKFGLRRSRLRGTGGTWIWVGWSILAHNLWQTARVS